MGSIHKRRMEAEAKANQNINQKDYHHTAAYALLAGENSEAIRASAMTGKEINTRLTERAKTYVRNQAALSSYQESHLGTRNFRSDGLNASDEELVKKRHQQLSKDRQEQTRDYVEEFRARSERVANKIDLDPIDLPARPLNGVSLAKSDKTSTPRSAPARSRQPQRHRFQDRSYRHYDPYQ